MILLPLHVASHEIDINECRYRPDIGLLFWVEVISDSSNAVASFGR